MKTDLADLFSPYASKENIFPGQLNQEVGIAYEHFWETLKASQAFKLTCFVGHRESLWDVPRIGLLLADVVVLIGAGHDKMLVNAFQNLEHPIRLEVDGEVVEKTAMPAFLSFPPQWLQDWIEDAAPLITSGRLFYAPLRGIYYQTTGLDGEREFGVKGVQIDSSWKVWRSNKVPPAPPSQFLVANDFPNFEPISEMISCTLPFLAGVSLTSLQELMAEEENAFISFRSELAKVVPLFESERKKTESAEKLLYLAKEVRRDLVEPQIAKIDASLKKMLRYRALRMQGITLCTTALVLNGMSAESLSHIVPMAFSGGGLGLLINEYAERQKDMNGLKENPWYFAWRLGKLNKP